MYRNQYDTDVTTFSPAGRIHQVEYAMEAVKQGSAVVGMRSKDLVLVASLKRLPSELASYQKKVFKIDDHIVIGMAGLVSDGRVLTKHMIQECLNHKFVYETPLQVGRLVQDLSDKAQVFTQRSEKRPYGVGLMVAGFDKTGPHLYQTDPSGNFFEYKAQAIGARSQSAKTYLEKHYETFEGASLDDLIQHALTALKTTLQGGRITHRNVSIGYVGAGVPMTLLEDDSIKPHVDKLPDNEGEEKTVTRAFDEDDDDEESADKRREDAAESPSGDASGSSAAPSSRPAGMEDADVM